jgi:hypothetical protein
MKQITDTHPDIEKIMIEGYRRMPGSQKLRQLSDLTRAANYLARSETRGRHPEASERELWLRVASRWLSAELMRKVYGWDPDREGY